jgi:hypothetical protein
MLFVFLNLRGLGLDKGFCWGICILYRKLLFIKSLKRSLIMQSEERPQAKAHLGL